MQVWTAISDREETHQAIAEAIAQIEAVGSPSLLVINASATHDIDTVRAAFAEAFDCEIHGATSCRGVMSQSGHTVEMGNGIGVLALSDDEGDIGTGAASLSDGAVNAASAAMRRALEAADRVGEAPDLVWVSATPGIEEDVLSGIQDVIGPDVPVVGGSAADNTVAGDWRLFDRDSVRADGVVVTACFSSGEISDVFQNGYSPTENSGVVTRSQGRRIFEIDGRPAVEVYAEWTGGQVLPGVPNEPANILAASTLWPFGRLVVRRDKRMDFILVHPSGANPDGSIDVFAEVHEGAELTQMTGTADALIARAGQVAELSNYALKRQGREAKGALVVFCGGCMLSVQNQVDEVVESIRGAMGEAPFLGVFTFGEQGRLPVGGNLHGNLMISCVTFGE